MRVLVEGSRLLSILNAVSIDKEIETVELVFRPDGLYAKNINDAQHILSYCVFRPEFFLNYDVPEEQEVTIDIANILKPIKIHKSKNINIAISNDKIKFVTDKGDEMWTTMSYIENKPTMEITDTSFGKVIKTEFVNIDKYSYAEIILPKTQRERLINPLGEDTVAIVIENGVLRVEQTIRGMQGVKSVLSDKVHNPTNTKILVSTAYLKKAFNSIISTKAVIAIAPNSPIVVSERTTDYEININIAPKYEIEEVSEEEFEEEEEEVEIDVGE